MDLGLVEQIKAPIHLTGVWAWEDRKWNIFPDINKSDS